MNAVGVCWVRFGLMADVHLATDVGDGLSGFGLAQGKVDLLVGIGSWELRKLPKSHSPGGPDSRDPVMAIVANATALIFVLNHLSDSAKPSAEDVRIMRQLVEVGKVMGIPIHDQLILTNHGFTSLTERGLL